MAGLDEFAERLLGESTDSGNLFQCGELVAPLAEFPDEALSVAENELFADVQRIDGTEILSFAGIFLQLMPQTESEKTMNVYRLGNLSVSLELKANKF